MSDSRWIGAVFLAFAGLGAACGADELQELRVRAAFDMDCPKGSLHIHDLGNGAEGVTGCGERATYVQSCHGFDTNCTWVRNGGREERESEDRE